MKSKRINTISSMLESSKSVADIGCDHGYLIIDAFINQNIEEAIAIDNKKMPLEKAINNIKPYDFFDQVSFILSDGLEGLDRTVDAIVISGMGGLLMIEILEKHFEKVKEASLILQPNRNVYDVRKYLTNKSYQIVNEAIVYEDKKYYEIIKFEKGTNLINYTDDELLFGPILLKNRNDLFYKKLKNDLRILKNIPYQTVEIQTKIRKIEELL